MEKIKMIKISLMKKDENFVIDEETGKGNYIIRASATYSPETYLQLQGDPSLNEEEYLKYLEDSLNIVYENLLRQSDHIERDSIGIWIESENGKKIETSLEFSTLEMIESQHGVNPLFDILKVSLEELIKNNS